MTYTNEQLKQALARMLPEEVIWEYKALYYRDDFRAGPLTKVLPTELLHLCWLVEESLDKLGDSDHYWLLYLEYLTNFAQEISAKDSIHATWQQRTIALAKVKGIEIWN